MRDIHGPWTAADFKAGVGIPVTKGKGYSDTYQMDAFVSDDHIGMIYEEQSDGYDRIIEAKGD
ncbi:hypothetical protein [Nocardioides sp.]|uniref:hypothetical protein n=1 Tax=Nocardioides sp. TaxID=35761 RepID=UPI0039E38837